VALTYHTFAADSLAPVFVTVHAPFELEKVVTSCAVLHPVPKFSVQNTCAERELKAKTSARIVIDLINIICTKVKENPR